MRSDEVDPIALGDEVLVFAAAQMERYMTTRRSLSNVEIFDVPFERIQADIGQVVAEIYGAAGLELRTAARERMAAWLAANPEQPGHDYSLERYGLSRSRIEDAFADYLGEFGATLTEGAPVPAGSHRRADEQEVDR
jgi:hypothetical protein